VFRCIAGNTDELAHPASLGFGGPAARRSGGRGRHVALFPGYHGTGGADTLGSCARGELSRWLVSLESMSEKTL
jgi:hypothetical protein